MSSSVFFLRNQFGYFHPRRRTSIKNVSPVRTTTRPVHILHSGSIRVTHRVSTKISLSSLAAIYLPYISGMSDKYASIAS